MLFRSDFDDGFVAWLNGTEIIRRNVAAGAITNTTPAAGNHEASRGDSSPQPVEFFPLNPALLVEGTNVLAVSSHNVSLTSSDLSLIIEVYTNEIHLTRGPFIQMPVSNQVTIVWRTDAATDSVVDYGLDTNYGGSISDSSPVTEHVVNIPGLLPNTNYYYRVRSGGVTLTPDGYFFRTKRVGTQPFRFVVLGDFGAGTAGMSNVAAQINARDFDLFLTVGDNIYPSGQPESFDPYWFSLYGPTMRRVPCFPVLGNHDVMTSNGQPLLDAFYLPTNGPVTEVERNYSFDYGSVHFAAVDVNVFTPTPDFTKIAAIKSWLSNDLAATAQPWKIV